MAPPKKTKTLADGENTASPNSEVYIPPLKETTIEVRLVGLSPLVVHAWSEKAKKEMRDKQQQEARTKKAKKDPTADFNGARYRIDEGADLDGFPSKGIKGAMINACRHVEGLPMTLARGSFSVNFGDELVPILAPDSDKPAACEMREDSVRVGGKGPGTGVADLRYRPEYKEWEIPVRVSFPTTQFSPQAVINLLRHAGRYVGLGENRPEKGGQWGMFDVKMDPDAVKVSHSET